MMAKQMDEILGAGSLQTERRVPGTLEGESESIRYVSFDGKEDPSKIFRAVTRQVNPPLMSGGGVVLEGCVIWLPDGTPFYCLYFHGDVAGWQKQIEQGAQELGVLSAKIDAGNIAVSDGRSFELSECKVVFD